MRHVSNLPRDFTSQHCRTIAAASLFWRALAAGPQQCRHPGSGFRCGKCYPQALASKYSKCDSRSQKLALELSVAQLGICRRSLTLHCQNFHGGAESREDVLFLRPLPQWILSESSVNLQIPVTENQTFISAVSLTTIHQGKCSLTTCRTLNPRSTPLNRSSHEYTVQTTVNMGWVNPSTFRDKSHRLWQSLKVFEERLNTCPLWVTISCRQHIGTGLAAEPTCPDDSILNFAAVKTRSSTSMSSLSATSIPARAPLLAVRLIQHRCRLNFRLVAYW